MGSFNFRTLVSKKSIIISPRLRFLLYSPSNEVKCYSILDIRAKCNILFIKIAKNLSCVIYSVNTFTIFIVTSNQFSFISAIKIKIEIAKGVNCKDMFFLVNNSLKTLLGMPFISKMKMAIDYKDDGLWDNTFTNLKDSRNAYTVIIIPLLKSITRRKV
jgi:hypothetical protein